MSRKKGSGKYLGGLLQIRLPTRMMLLLEDTAKATNQTVSEVARHALEEELGYIENDEEDECE